jgi:arginyl-tRNA synthetase
VSLFARFSRHIDTALDALVATGAIPEGIDRHNVTVEPPRDPAHGDLATNAAMVLGKPAGLNPRSLAELLAAELGKIEGVAAAEIAGPGFINLRLDASAQARRRTSNMSPPTRPAPCIWAIAAVQSLGMRWPAC